jgi:uncharacterized protein (TIGR03437 family)
MQAPFRINAQVPPDMAAGSYTLRVQSPYGTATLPVDVVDSAPAIYSGGVANQNGQSNGPLTPAARGQSITVYGTGFGAVVAAGNQFRTQGPVTGILNGVEIPAGFAGLTAGIVGLYQVNLPVPAGMAPGIDLPLVLRQFDRVSNTVFVAIQ